MPSPSQVTPAARRRMRLLVGSLVLGSLLACGYKGPLYLPPPENPASSLTQPPGPDAPPGPTAN